jgi:hypothetical protein
VQPVTTFYRTPDIVIDAHEWHVVVWRKCSRVSVCYRWRPVSLKTHRWQSIKTWKGRKPLDLWRYFAPYKRHIEHAKGCDARRREAAAKLAAQRTPTGAMVQNVTRPHEWGASLSA